MKQFYDALNDFRQEARIFRVLQSEILKLNEKQRPYESDLRLHDDSYRAVGNEIGKLVDELTKQWPDLWRSRDDAKATAAKPLHGIAGKTPDEWLHSVFVLLDQILIAAGGRYKDSPKFWWDEMDWGRLDAMLAELDQRIIEVANVPPTPDEESDTPAAKIKPSWEKAYLGWSLACDKTGRTLSYRQGWEWLRENGSDEYDPPANASTFEDYCTQYRRAIDGRQNQPRAGRKGRSIAAENSG